jgi:hypothetical protein
LKCTVYRSNSAIFKHGTAVAFHLPRAIGLFEPNAHQGPFQNGRRGRSCLL